MAFKKSILVGCRSAVLATIFSFVVSVPLIYAAPDGAAKVGVVDYQKIMQQMPEAKQAEDALNAASSPFKKEFDRKRLELQKAADAFSLESPNMSKQDRSLKEKDLSLKSQALQKYQMEKMGVMKVKRQELFLPIQKKLEAAVKAVAGSDGYSLVFDKQTMVYGESNCDLTLKVMAQLKIK